MYNPAYKAAQRRKRRLTLIAVGREPTVHKSNPDVRWPDAACGDRPCLGEPAAVILGGRGYRQRGYQPSFEILVLFQRLHAEGRTIILSPTTEIAQYGGNITLRDGHVTADTVNTNILSAAEALTPAPRMMIKR